MAESIYMKSVDGRNVTVSLITGHAITIGTMARLVPSAFVADALKTGRVTAVEHRKSDAEIEAKAVATVDRMRIDQIKESLRKAMEAGDTSFMTGTGIPDARKLDVVVGLNVTAKERDVAWSELLEEAGETP